MKIVLQDLTKIFPSRNKKSTDEVVAVDHFNFEIPDGKLIDKITTYDEYLASDEMAKKRHVFQVNEEDAADN